MTTVRFRKHVGEEERHVYVHAAVGGEDVIGRSGTSIVVDFDSIRDTETGDPVSEQWFDTHHEELCEMAIHAMKNKVHRARNPIGV